MAALAGIVLGTVVGFFIAAVDRLVKYLKKLSSQGSKE